MLNVSLCYKIRVHPCPSVVKTSVFEFALIGAIRVNPFPPGSIRVFRVFRVGRCGSHFSVKRFCRIRVHPCSSVVNTTSNGEVHLVCHKSCRICACQKKTRHRDKTRQNTTNRDISPPQSAIISLFSPILVHPRL